MIYVLIILIGLGYVLNSFSKKYSHYNLTMKRNFNKNCIEIGEEFEITNIIENNKILPVTFLRILEQVPKQLSYKMNTGMVDMAGNTYHETTMSIMSNQRIKRTYKANFSERGRYFFSKTELIVGDFLGTSTITTEYDLMQEIVVYPGHVSINNEIKPYGSYYGDISVQRWIINDPILNIGIREYTGSEPQKNIHWASSLRLGKLMVKNFDYTTDNTVMLVLNIESQKPFWAGLDVEKIERCISITRAVMEQLEEAGVQYGFSTNAQLGELVNKKKYIPFGHGGPHFYSILEMLGRINYGISHTFEELLNDLIFINEKSITYILITPYVFDNYVDDINILSRNAERTVLISLQDGNLNNISEKIMIYTGKEELDEHNS